MAKAKKEPRRVYDFTGNEGNDRNLFTQQLFEKLNEKVGGDLRMSLHGNSPLSSRRYFCKDFKDIVTVAFAVDFYYCEQKDELVYKARTWMYGMWWKSEHFDPSIETVAERDRRLIDNGNNVTLWRYSGRRYNSYNWGKTIRSYGVNVPAKPDIDRVASALAAKYEERLSEINDKYSRTVRELELAKDREENMSLATALLGYERSDRRNALSIPHTSVSAVINVADKTAHVSFVVPLESLAEATGAVLALPVHDK